MDKTLGVKVNANEKIFDFEKRSQNFGEVFSVKSGLGNDFNRIIPFLKAIESMPDELIERSNPKEIDSYFRGMGIIVTTYNDNNEVKNRSKRNAWDCSLAISALLVTNALPVAKITKIKKYIESLGGVTKAAKALFGAGSAEQKTEKVLIALGALVAELTEINTVKKDCFD
ncbi:hypothetical protein [Paenibacillus popilliae]|uniref:Uncharacterized protein n=1 Tax=Paenibacillus popilliae ATCC 14706 TaxID=1212764 RepID=M9LKH8_PAEPP|nr:hypothetical protein [Paenibacillus popilliae]GAC43820.1 hypothetical protein PPOP_3220 [Paenibacillus popilliae ATCC 14706]